MLTQEDLQAIGVLIKMEAGALIRTGGDRLDQKIEASLAFSRKAHAEIMEALFKSNEINGQEVKMLEQRVELLEEHGGLAKPHKN